MIDPRTLTDDALIATVSRLARFSRETTAELIAHLAVMEERNLHLACGFSSLFGYGRRVLHFSESEAYDRMQAARAARRFPVILAMLAGGSLHLTAVRLLAPHLHGEDHLALLGGALHKSAEAVRELVARWAPRADVPTLVRRLPDRRPGGPTQAPATGPSTPQPSSAPPPSSAPSPSPGPAAGNAEPRSPDGATHEPGTQPVVVSPDVRPQPPVKVPRPAVEPLAPGRNLIRFTGDDETVALLREAQELLSHRLPDGDVAAIVKQGLALVVEKARRERHAAASRPRGTAQAKTQEPAWDAAPTDHGAHDPCSRTIPAEVQRPVWERDGGQCSFIGRDGLRCEERRFLEYHHLRPWIVGGPPTVENIALRCRAHNQYVARVYFAPIRDAMSAAACSDARPKPRPKRETGRTGPPPRSAPGSPPAART